MCDHNGRWLSRIALADYLSQNIMDVSPRAIERWPVESKLVLGKRRYSVSSAEAFLRGELERAEVAPQTPGTIPLKMFR